MACFLCVRRIAATTVATITSHLSLKASESACFDFADRAPNV
jgi:hypothetical protein